MLGNQMTILYLSPIGTLKIDFHQEKVADIEFLHDLEVPEAPSAPVITQLQNYFSNASFQFDLPLHLEGTLFQKKIWQALREIPCGTTVTYKQLAERFQTSPRAIGNACRTNPIPVIIPCHRVVSQNGLGGFAGDTSGKLLEIKKWLLRHEQLGLQPL